MLRSGPFYVGLLNASKPKKLPPGPNPGSLALTDDGCLMQNNLRSVMVDFDKTGSKYALRISLAL